MAKAKNLNVKGSVGIMPFVIRGEGFILTDCEPGKEEQELEFETYDEAEKTLELIQFPMKKPNAKIIEI